jgi:hypothetical protein
MSGSIGEQTLAAHTGFATASAMRRTSRDSDSYGSRRETMKGCLIDAASSRASVVEVELVPVVVDIRARRAKRQLEIGANLVEALSLDDERMGVVRHGAREAGPRGHAKAEVRTLVIEDECGACF